MGNGEKIEYLYDDKWFALGLTDDNNNLNLEVLRKFVLTTQE
jgi:hypothetical protein